MRLGSRMDTGHCDEMSGGRLRWVVRLCGERYGASPVVQLAIHQLPAIRKRVSCTSQP